MNNLNKETKQQHKIRLAILHASTKLIIQGTAKENLDFCMQNYNTTAILADHSRIIAEGTEEQNKTFVRHCYDMFRVNNPHIRPLNIDDLMYIEDFNDVFFKFINCNYPDNYEQLEQVRINKIDLLKHCLAISILRNDNFKERIKSLYAEAIDDNNFFDLEHHLAIAMLEYLSDTLIGVA